MGSIEFVSTDPKIIGERVKFYRERAKLKQTELDILVGYKPGMIHAVEKGAKRMSHQKRQAVAQALGVPPAALTATRQLTDEELQALELFLMMLQTENRPHFHSIQRLLLDFEKDFKSNN